MCRQLLSFSSVLVGSFLILMVDGSCYYPDGSFPEDYVYVPCSGDEFTSCCILSEGDQCLSNGLCYYPGGEYMFRGACTDKSWGSENCFQHCKGSDSYSSSTYDQLVHCGDDRYCCSSDSSTCCNDDSKVFTVGAASVIKDLSSTASYTIPIETPTEAADTSTSRESYSYPTNTESLPKDTKSKSASPAVATATSTATPPNPSSSSEQGSNSGTSKTPLIAGAVGGVVVLILSVTLVFFLVRRRYRKKLATGTNQQSFPMSSDGFQKLPDKSPRPIEVPAPLHSPAPPYQPPAYQSPPPQHNAVEMDNSYLPPGRNQWGQPVYEVPAQPYRGMSK